jgi:hypothetical protein
MVVGLLLDERIRRLSFGRRGRWSSLLPFLSTVLQWPLYQSMHIALSAGRVSHREYTIKTSFCRQRFHIADERRLVVEKRSLPDSRKYDQDRKHYTCCPCIHQPSNLLLHPRVFCRYLTRNIFLLCSLYIFLCGFLCIHAFQSTTSLS